MSNRYHPRTLLRQNGPGYPLTMRETIRSMNLRRRTEVTLNDIARELNPITRGWIAYYGRFTRSALYPLVRYIDQILAA